MHHHNGGEKSIVRVVDVHGELSDTLVPGLSHQEACALAELDARH